MSRIAQLTARRIDANIASASRRNEVYTSIQQSDAVKYAIGAMQPIDPEYTKNTLEQGERVKRHLAAELAGQVEFRYQGSTTNDTHIKAQSDIDLLVILTRWEFVQKPQVVQYPYTGDVIDEMLTFREQSEKCIVAAFPQASVDDSGSKSITIQGGSLSRKVDVVPANWWNTNTYAASRREEDRGVSVFDRKKEKFVNNLPFLHNERVALRDTQTNGWMRKAARLMKSLRYDSGKIEMSSYDIVGIAYNIPDSLLVYRNGYDLSIVEGCRVYCRALLNDERMRSGMLVPNGMRRVFDATEGASVEGLNQLVVELDALGNDILDENRHAFASLSAARVLYSM